MKFKFLVYMVCVVAMVFLISSSVGVTSVGACENMCPHEKKEIRYTEIETITLVGPYVKRDQKSLTNEEYWKNWKEKHPGACIMKIEVLAVQEQTGWNKQGIYCCIYYHSIY